MHQNCKLVGYKQMWTNPQTYGQPQNVQYYCNSKKGQTRDRGIGRFLMSVYFLSVIVADVICLVVMPSTARRTNIFYDHFMTSE